MRKFLLSLTFVFAVLPLCAQRTQDVVYLSNGSIIRGEVVGYVSGGDVRLRTSDGSLMVYDASDVIKIEQETLQHNSVQGRHRGLDFSVDAGWHFATKGGDNMASLEIGLGKKFNKNFYWGIGTGAFLPVGGDNDPQIPVTSDFKVYFPLTSSSIIPGGLLRLGYVFNTADDVTVGSGRYEVTVDVPDCIMLQVMPSMQIAVSKKVDFNLAVGYTHMFPVKGGSGSGAFSIKTGFSFHKSDRPKPAIPVRDKGVQLTVEGGNVGLGGKISNAWQGGLAVTYKFNSRLSAGIGAGYEYIHDYELDDLTTTTLLQQGEIIDEYSMSSGLNCIHSGKLFARGNYRFTDSRLSPFVTCDAGINFLKLEKNPYSDVNQEIEDDDDRFEPQSAIFFAAPAVGLSLRTTNNSYLELKAGYMVTSAIAGKSTERETVSGRDERVVRTSTKAFGLSAPFVSIGFTHTFSWGGNWF